MFRKSRFAVLGITLFFFLMGALSAYARCLEISGNFSHHSETGNAVTDESVFDGESLHCPDEAKIYAVGKRTNLDNGKSFKVKVITDDAVAQSSIATSSRLAVRLSPSSLRYRLIPLYQLKVVYRI